jgi:hypothetical protein
MRLVLCQLAGDIVRLATPGFYDDHGRVISVDAVNRCALLRFWPRIDYDMIGPQRQIKMPVDYRPPAGPFEVKRLQAQSFEKTKIRLPIAPNQELPLTLWNGCRFWGIFQILNVPTIEIFVKPHELFQADMDRFPSLASLFQREIDYESSDESSTEFILERDTKFQNDEYQGLWVLITDVQDDTAIAQVLPRDVIGHIDQFEVFSESEKLEVPAKRFPLLWQYRLERW